MSSRFIAEGGTPITPELATVNYNKFRKLSYEHIFKNCQHFYFKYITYFF